MKNVAIAFAMLFGTQIYATTLSKVYDGAVARCSNGSDVFTSKLNGVFSFSNPKVFIEDDQVSIELKLNFFECQKSESGFKFVKVNYSAESEIEFMDNTIRKVEFKKEIRAVNDKLELVGIVDLGFNLENEESQIVKLVLSKNTMSKNEFSASSSKGDMYIDLDMTTLRELSSATYNGGKELLTSGKYRLFIDSQNNKAFIQ